MLLSVVAAKLLLTLCVASVALSVASDDANAQTTGTITGQVVEKVTGIPVPEICVRAWGTNLFSDIADDDGRFSIPDLPAGDYQIEIRQCSGSQLEVIWWGGGTSLDDAAKTAVDGTTLDIAVEMAIVPTWSAISGTVTDDAGQPVAGSCIDSFPTTGLHYTRSDGQYLLFVQPASYLVRFNSCTSENGLGAQWYDMADGSGTATSVAALAGQPTMGIDGQLASGSRIFGYLIDRATGQGATGYCVVAFSAGNDRVTTTGIEPDGYYEILRAQPVELRLLYDACATDSREEFYYPYATSLETAERLFPDPGEQLELQTMYVGEARFADAFTSIFYTDILWLADAGITRGCNPPTNDQYCPDQPVTRGQMAAFLHRALPDLATGTPATFTDDNTSEFETDIEWLASVGITRGCNPPTNDRYCPDNPVTRGQMAAFLHRALPDLATGTPATFTDDNTSEFETDIEWLASVGITRGCNPPTNDLYCPDNPVTRGQMAAFLFRALGEG